MQCQKKMILTVTSPYREVFTICRMNRSVDDVYFDGATTKVVDSWMSSSKAQASASDDIDDMIRRSMFAETNVGMNHKTGGNSRGGLGFTSDRPTGVAFNELEQRLLSKRKRQKETKPAETSYKNLSIEKSYSNSMIDDSSISKIDMISSKKGNKSIVQQTHKDLSNQKIAAKSSTNLEPSSNAKLSKNHGLIEQGKDPQTTNNETRKRKKTRSKQKNIRRDTRTDDKKPVHLQYGSKEYKGRPLSEVIILHLM